jgi:hypothetical protein
VDALTGAVVVLSLSTAVLLLAQRRWLLGMLVLAYLAPAIAIDLPAAGRMTAVLFPMFIALASALRNCYLFWTVTVSFALLQLFLAARFYTWRTPY